MKTPAAVKTIAGVMNTSIQAAKRQNPIIVPNPYAMLEPFPKSVRQASIAAKAKIRQKTRLGCSPREGSVKK
jgi:hypothetical protein